MFILDITVWQLKHLQLLKCRLTSPYKFPRNTAHILIDYIYKGIYMCGRANSFEKSLCTAA